MIRKIKKDYWKMCLWNFPTLDMTWSLIPHVEQLPNKFYPQNCPPSFMKSF